MICMYEIGLAKELLGCRLSNNEVNSLGMGCLFPIPDAAFHGKGAQSVLPFLYLLLTLS